MGWRDRVSQVMGSLGQKATVEWDQPADAIGLPPGGRNIPAVREAIAWATSLTPADVWNSQPYVRTVVSFLARNTAQVGIHTHRRISENERERLRDHPVARLLSRPNPNTTGYELIYQLVGDLALYDRAYWLVGPKGGEIQAIRIPPHRIIEHVAEDPIGEIKTFRMIDARGRRTDIPGGNVLYFPGWNPTDPIGLPSSPLESLKNTIAEQAAAFAFRKYSWENGAQVSRWITRPADAPKWSDGARQRFMADVKAQFGKDGPQRGGVMLFEDGMSMGGAQFNAREAEWIESAKLSLGIVASAYHVNPTMVGLLDNANYSNVREFRRGLYGDTLGPTFAQVEDRLNTFLVPRFDDSDGVYVEFNIAEKLQGSFEEQATAFQTAVGRPWMTAAEARARLNLTPLDGTDADQLVTPLNVLVGGLAAPNDTAPPTEPNPVSPPEASSRVATVKALRAPRLTKTRDRTVESHETKAREVVSQFFRKQAQVVKSRLGAKSSKADWWDAARWDRDLAADLYRLAVSASSDVAAKTLDSIGFEPDLYDVDRTLNFLKALTERVAGSVNKVTKAQLDDALDSDDPDAVDRVFENAEGSRAAQIAVTATTAATAFGRTEAAKQAAGDRASKTWVVTSANPRPEHVAMNGETVPLDQPFSNGAMWPGDGVLDVDELAGCTCDLLITTET